MRGFTHLLLACLALLALAAPASAVPQPFELRDGQVVITVTINGKQLPALLDTGAPESLIETDLARELGVLRSQKMRMGCSTHGAAGGSVACGSTNRKIVVDFGAGPISSRLRTYEAGHAFAAEGVRVVIGMDFLEALVVSLDFQRMAIDFQRSPDFTPPQGEPLKLTLTQGGWGRITLPVSVAGARANLLLDTAASSAMHLDSAFVARTPVLKVLPVSSRRISGIDGIRDHDAIVVPQVTLGGQAFESVRASSGSFRQFERGGNKMDGVVGIDLLKRFNLVMDFAGQRIWMTPNGS
jgi:predicted aspartyl protease